MLFSQYDPTHFLIEPADLAPGGEASEHLSAPHHEAVSEIAQWAVDYLCRPHGDLGRTGPVCPFVEMSMNRCLFFLTSCDVKASEIDQVRERVQAYRRWFQSMEPTTGEGAIFKTILIVFPEIRTEEAPSSVDVLQKELKIDFVRQGLMLGQFHRINRDAGLWNEEFQPLRSPVPLLAIRHMVAGDIGFLQEKKEYLEAYVEHFAGRIPKVLQPRVCSILERAGLDAACVGLQA